MWAATGLPTLDEAMEEARVQGSELPPPVPPRPVLALLEALTDRLAGAWDLCPQRPRQLSLGALREGLRLGLGSPPSFCCSAPPPGAPLRARVPRTAQDCPVDCSLVNGTSQRGLVCCSFPRCWGLSCSGWGSGSPLPGPRLGANESCCGRTEQEGT